MFLECPDVNPGRAGFQEAHGWALFGWSAGHWWAGGVSLGLSEHIVTDRHFLFVSFQNGLITTVPG